jgi:hypothetical protein
MKIVATIICGDITIPHHPHPMWGGQRGMGWGQWGIVIFPEIIVLLFTRFWGPWDLARTEIEGLAAAQLACNMQTPWNPWDA